MRRSFRSAARWSGWTLRLLCSALLASTGVLADLEQPESCSPEAFRVDCHPEAGSNQDECLRRGCCWSPRADGPVARPLLAQPSCFFPADYDCYEAREVEDEQVEFNELRWRLERKVDCPKANSDEQAKRLQVTLSIHGDALINIKITEPDRRRFKPRFPEISLPKTYSKDGTTFYDHHNTKWLVAGSLLATLRVGNTTTANKLMVIHGATGTILFEADLGKLIYGRQFIQLSSQLASAQVYGLGLHLDEALLKSSGREYAKSYTLFNYGHPPQDDGRSSYSTYPFYINLAQLRDNEPRAARHIYWGEAAERRLLATGALMLNSNPMDVLVHSSGERGAALTWRLIGGTIDLYLFAGPQPNDVVRQYSTLVGTPALPAPWALGYHQSRYNYRDLMPIKSAWARTRGAGCPVESIWTDIEFLWRGTSYTLNNPELAQLVSSLKGQFDMHYVPIVDPAISIREPPEDYLALRLAQSLGLLAYNPPEEGSAGESSVAVVNSWAESGACGLLDFTHPLAVDYLKEVLTHYKEKINFDGLWLDMNEPEVFSNELDENKQSCARDPQLIYEPGGRKLTERTLCLTAQFSVGSHQDIHNLYAFYQSQAHYLALRALNHTNRPFIISRAQFPGQARFSGTWLGDLASTFEHLRWSLLATIESNWFGQPLVGADICGFFGSASDELCARWFSLGAFYPLARNHNGAMTRDQDPGAMGEVVQRAARLALMRRYSLLPLLYTLFYQSHKKGLPVVRSILFESFPLFELGADLRDLPQINDQFMWGSSLMIAPVLESGQEYRSVYLPQGRWYDLSLGLTGSNMDEGPYDALTSNWPTQNYSDLTKEARSRLDSLRRPIDCASPAGCTLDHLYTPLGAVNLYLKGGQIIATFRHFEHTQSVGALWRDASFFLEVALDPGRAAAGTLFWDDGQTDPTDRHNNFVDFWASDNLLLVSVVESRARDRFQLDGLLIYGVEQTGKQVKVELNRPANTKLNYDPLTKTLSCLFMTSSGDQVQPIALEKFQPLEITWLFDD